MHNYPQLFGYTVRKARIKKGWTQMETAERAGVNIKTIQNIETLVGNPCLIHLVPIVRVLEINPNILLFVLGKNGVNCSSGKKIMSAPASATCSIY